MMRERRGQYLGHRIVMRVKDLSRGLPRSGVPGEGGAAPYERAAVLTDN